MTATGGVDLATVGGLDGEEGNKAPRAAPAAQKPVNIEELLNKSLQGKFDSDAFKNPLHRIAFSSTEEVIINPGGFSWASAFCMCVFIILGFASLVMAVLSTRNTAIAMESTEISYIEAENPPWDVPPWGYVRQPNGATSRKIGQEFTYAMPQTILFYSIGCASFGIFTVAFFCSELYVQDLGVDRVKQMGDVINKGVDVYVSHTVPIMLLVMSMVACFIYAFTSVNFLISMTIGGSTCLACSNLGTSMNFQGAPRLTHSLNYDLVQSMQLAVRIGAIGGLSAHAMAQLGVVGIWILLRDAASLVGFGTGASIVAFYNRIAGGIFAKGADIGSDFVSAMIGEDVDDFNMESLEMLKHGMHLDDKDGDGDIDEEHAQKQAFRDPNAKMHEEDVGFITMDEVKIRESIEKQMEQTLQTMHPVNYLDCIGENIADVGGTSSDLFETMCITLATAVIMGSKSHDVPYFGTSLPFNIISTGTLGCSLATYYVWCHDSHSPARIRNQVRLNLLFVMALVQGVCALVCYLHWSRWHTISYTRMVNYDLIILLGLLSPEVCAMICEFFTSVNCPPVARLAQDADLGMIQVVLQGLGQGFVSAGVPSVVNILVQILAFRWEGFYGLVLLACASQACTGWQATLAAYGAVANNACRMVHLTTVNEMAHHRANVLATIGTTTAHNGKCVAGQNAFFATTALLGALLADKYTKLGKNWQQTVSQELSEFTRAGMLAGIIFTMLFLANTLTSCINMAKSLVEFCKDNKEVLPRLDKKFPATHIVPLKNLVAFCAVKSYQLSFSPMLNTFAAPLVIGQLFGFKGLMMLVSGGNSVCFSLNMFLVNTGQAWDAARKYILFGMLKDKQGNPVGPQDEVYDILGIGEQIGGPLEDLTGPALNNFIKFIAVMSFVTSDLYDEFPFESWYWGMVQVVVNGTLIITFKFGIQKAIDQLQSFIRRRKEALDFEEGRHMLREIEERERALADRVLKEAEAEQAELGT